MALFKVKVTKKESGEEVEYRLYEWNPSMFQTNATLKLITSDYQSVKTDFNDIEKLDIYAGENFLAAFTAYDSFSSAMAFSSQFYEPESRFVMKDEKGNPVKNEQGEEIKTRTVKKEFFDEFQNKYQELLVQENEINFKLITIDDIEDANPSFADLEMLSFMIDDEDE